jgi:hypothetical protein
MLEQNRILTNIVDICITAQYYIFIKKTSSMRMSLSGRKMKGGGGVGGRGGGMRQKLGTLGQKYPSQSPG